MVTIANATKNAEWSKLQMLPRMQKECLMIGWVLLWLLHTQGDLAEMQNVGCHVLIAVMIGQLQEESSENA
jgi:hypothetical protein